MSDPRAILEFWFGERARNNWFVRDAAFDAEIRRNFQVAVTEAAEDRLGAWERSPDGCLALVLLLDQFPRNIHRDSPRAFAADGKARAVASGAIDRGFDRAVADDRRVFFYLPFEHSEDLADQRRAVALIRQLAEEQQGEARVTALEYLDYAIRHEKVIERFGRFPHRNAVLGRPSTPEEEDFLKQPGSSF
ncbi:DUF924 family protein [Rhodospirillaceae bacterium SYSU D60014]|uniref:DUF924 family protein n=1 Tax=Virgifigura deserti TaxID=2268457 RepID=UPI000E65F3DE